jgi:hypothetical protein
VRAERATPSDLCPRYGVALQQAQAALARGDRPQAIAELQRAKAALRDCGREEARKPNLLAALPPTRA